ncbi:hypothetical protein RhiirA4_460253 [Rhizophagus irregularis]|uniref:Protein kinase domain-containing protein n=1 Tax=Rhizophagus irregularis TaxID=588596 RepID=A0A2I1GG78_9GLOM|nr:hypothetical protein RhiirA4_460253 [Rhizophagus irregularis]
MNDLENVEYLAKGGFGIVYKAIWRQGRIHTWNFDSNRWKRFRSERVVLKYIYNSQDNIAEFLREVESHVIANLGGSRGFTELDSNVGYVAMDVIWSLMKITMNAQNNDTYGVLPYVAPEVLRGKEYTQKSDIYGFGIIAYEVCIGLPPYHDIAHDRTLAIKISDEVVGLFYDYKREIVYNENTEICKQVEEVEEINKNLPSLTAHLSNTDTLSYTTHPQAIYTSRILDFKDLPESNLINLRIDFEDFSFRNLTEEQELLVDKLILNKEIKERYKKTGLCKGCKQPKTTSNWCRPCCSKRFQEEFKNWTSGNPEIDKFIQSIQLKANRIQIIEWIEYKNFENVEYLAKGGDIDTWNFDNNCWERYGRCVVLKCIHNSQDNIAELLKEAESHVIVNERGRWGVICCYGFTKNPETNEFMMIMERGINGSI